MQEKHAAGIEVDEHHKDCLHAVVKVDGRLQQAMRKPLG